MGFFFTMLWIEQWLKLMRFLPLKAWQEITTCMVSTTDVTLIVARQKEWSLYKSEPKYKQSCLPVAPFIRQYIFFFKSLTTPITVSCHIFTWLIPYYLGCRVKKKQVITCILPILCHWVMNWNVHSIIEVRSLMLWTNRWPLSTDQGNQPAVSNCCPPEPESRNFEGQNMWRKLSQVI